MIFNLLGGLLYRVITYTLVVTITSTSTIPIIRELPKATAAYLGMMQQLGLIEADAAAPNGFNSTAPSGMEGMVPEIGPDGEPVGFLLNADAFQMDETQFEPDVLADPISVSRVQSAYARTDAVSGTLVITFSVTNNRPPAVTPDLPENATITETIEAVSAIDFDSDPNVIHNVLLADSLLPANAVLISAFPMPDRSGDDVAWNLGNIPPLDSVTATLTVEIVPGSVPDFVELDTGATAWGTLEGRMVTAATAPASLAPDEAGGTPVSDWLRWTVDADYYDEYMVAQAAELGNDWQQMFGYVRSLGYESYKGSLRGTRGTLWSEAGNSLDQASLLIAMLRGSGIPARYRHGTLSTARAQELILSMFPEPQGTIGHIPSGTEVADPVNDPQLLAETMDYWWAEAYLPGLGWTDLSPCFADALPGQAFHDGLATDGTDQIAEVPDGQRHKVTMKVKVEKYHPMNMGQSGLDYTYPLSHTFNTVELVGRPVTLGHLVNSDADVGVFWVVQHTYVPYFAVEGSKMVIEGDPFQDILSNFPFGNFVTTAEWLLFAVRDADGNVEHYEREIVDKVGFESRQSGGTVSVSADGGTAPMFTALDQYTVVFAPSLYVKQALFDLVKEMGRDIPQVQQLYQRYQELVAIDPGSAAAVAAERDLIHTYNRLTRLNQHLLAALHYGTVDELTGAYGQVLLTSIYPNSPRVAIVSTTVHGDDSQVSIDLLRMDIRMVSAPQQLASIPRVVRVYYGFANSYIEEVVLDVYLATCSESTVTARSIGANEVFEAAEENSIDIIILLPDTGLEQLASLDISDEAKARISNTLLEGKVVWMPNSMVFINGEPHLAWYEIALDTGETISVGEMASTWLCKNRVILDR